MDWEHVESTKTRLKKAARDHKNEIIVELKENLETAKSILASVLVSGLVLSFVALLTRKTHKTTRGLGIGRNRWKRVLLLLFLYYLKSALEKFLNQLDNEA